MFVNQNADAYDRKTDTYIVAYIDLLGMTNRIRGADRQLVMNKLYNLYTFSMKLTKDIQIEENQDIRFKIFSDNIIIAKSLSTETQQRKRDIRSLLMCAGHFQKLTVSDSVGNCKMKFALFRSTRTFYILLPFKKAFGKTPESLDFTK